MGASQRLSRGFNRLGLFLAAIPLLVGGAITIIDAMSEADSASTKHQKLLCAHKFFQRAQVLPGTTLSELDTLLDKYREKTIEDAVVKEQGLLAYLLPDNRNLSLKKLNCSHSDYDTVKYGEARNPPEFNWLSVFASALQWPGLAITLAVTLAVTLGVYGVVRVIGWVTSGFAAS
jgi:hypothetical protein